MKALVGVVGLLLVVAVVGLLARQQLAPARPAAAVGQGAALPAGSPQQQVEQVRQAVDIQMQARPMPDDAR